MLLRGFVGAGGEALVTAVRRIQQVAPPRVMYTPGGRAMSARMTACGRWGWVSDRQGYRYVRAAPGSDQPWPEMPSLFLELARRAAAVSGLANGFQPDSCLINEYAVGAGMTLHRDENERSFDHPIVSVSLGMPTQFLLGGLTRSAPTSRVLLRHGDVLVWGDRSRLRYHGVTSIKAGPSVEGLDVRINLTFRVAG